MGLGLTIKKDELVQIGDDIFIKCKQRYKNGVFYMVIDAPKDIRIRRIKISDSEDKSKTIHSTPRSCTSSIDRF